MAATLTDRRAFDDRWLLERKLDGVRCLAWVEDGRATLRSRNDTSFDAAFPEVVDALGRAARGRLLVDGEIVSFDDVGQTRFSLLQHRLGSSAGRTATGTASAPVRYFAFDLLWFDGHDVRPLDLVTRKAALREVLAFDDVVRFTEHQVADGRDRFGDACRAGWEGLVAKRAASTYQGRRSRDWLKLRCGQEQEFVVVGFTAPKGQRHGFGALLLAVREGDQLRYAGKVGTGFDRATLVALREQLDPLVQPTAPVAERVRERDARWVRPLLVVQVAFGEWTDAGRLRHPSFVGMRYDKQAVDVVRERPA